MTPLGSSGGAFVIVDAEDVPDGVEARWFTLWDDAVKARAALNRGEALSWPPLDSRRRKFYAVVAANG